MLEHMRFRKRARSWLTAALVAAVGLPYMSLCCVVAPITGTEGRAACCPMSGGSARMHHAPVGDHGSSRTAEHHGSRGVHAATANGRHCPGEDAPARSCCASADTFQAAVQKSADPVSACGVAALASLRSLGLLDAEAMVVASTPTLRRFQPPPLYLTNSSFLI